ncbi:hypothetical protein K1719_002201 [Acacia pycnantha]|nr:hypothetical protein K1719_002201 [Acacia pycnantha]
MHEGKLFGMKSHDCHVFFQRLLPWAFKALLKHIWSILTEFSMFFREICASELNVEKLRHLEASMPITLCNLKVGGPQQYRWMYPFERFLRILENKIKNPRRALSLYFGLQLHSVLVKAFIGSFPMKFFGLEKQETHHQCKTTHVTDVPTTPVGHFSFPNKLERLPLPAIASFLAHVVPIDTLTATLSTINHRHLPSNSNAQHFISLLNSSEASLPFFAQSFSVFLAKLEWNLEALMATASSLTLLLQVMPLDLIVSCMQDFSSHIERGRERERESV